MTENEKIAAAGKRAEEICRSYSDKSWFIDSHILKVLENAEWLLTRYPQANSDVVRTAVWLHDIIYFVEPSHIETHAQEGAEYAVNILRQADVCEENIQKIYEMVRCHSCKGENIPVSLEGKILATADAMAHFTPDFFLALALYDNDFQTKGVTAFKKYSLTKLEKDFNGKKFFFEEAREKVKETYLKMRAFFECC